MTPKGLKSSFFCRKPIFENRVSNKKSIFHPLGVYFMSKITLNSDSSSNPKFKKSVFCSVLFWFLWKNQKIEFFWFFGFFTKIKINHYKNHFFEFQVDVYRSIFWRGIRIWRYLKKIGPLKGQNFVYYRKPISENSDSNKKLIFHPLGVYFMSKIT